MAKQPAVYILTNKPNGTIYVGVTSNLARRLEDHRLRPKGSFTARYNLQRLVHVERFDDIEEGLKTVILNENQRVVVPVIITNCIYLETPRCPKH